MDWGGGEHAAIVQKNVALRMKPKSTDHNNKQQQQEEYGMKKKETSYL